MPLLLVLLEIFVGTLAVWVLTFNLALYGHWPVGTLEILFPVIWILLLGAMARPWARRVRAMRRREIGFARNMLVLGCLLGGLVLVTSRPDADDVGYMYQTQVDALSPDKPFTSDPFIVPFQGHYIEVPFLSENEAYEVMVVVVAKLVGIEPLQAYHNVFAFFAAILWGVTYALLFRRFRVPRSRVALALVATVTFLLLDGNLHRSFGNFTLIRIWQGKVIVWAILGPAFLLFALRFLARPSRYRYCLLLVTGAVCFFVNRSSVFLFAVLGIAIAASYYFAFGRNRRRAIRILALVASVAPLWIAGAYIAISSIPQDSSLPSVLSEMSGIASAPRAGGAMPEEAAIWGSSWWTSLYVLVIGSFRTLVRDVLFLTMLPFLVVPRPLNRFLLLLSLAVAAFALSPVAGPAWYYFFPRVYWRLYYVLPLPLCAGLVTHLLYSSPSPASGRRPETKLALVAIAAASTVWAMDRPVLSAANGVELKSPFEYRFRHEPLEFARSVATRLDGKLVLAPDEVSNILALTEYGSIDLVFTRLVPGRTVGTEAMAVWATAHCRVNDRTAAAVRQLLGRGVNAIIMSSCGEAALRELRELLPGYRLVEEEEVATASLHLYWVLRDDPGSASPLRHVASEDVPP